MKLLQWMFCLWAISLLGMAPLYAAQDIGSVTEVTGGVDILRGGKLPAEPAKVGTAVAQGDVIRTKSAGKVQLHFKDDSVLTIAPDSRVALNEYVYDPGENKREATIKIFQGLVHTVVNKIMKKETPDFIVETQTAVMGVRGTDYYTLVAPAVSDIYNNSGVTEVRNIFSEIPGTVKLQNREYTQVSRNLPPTLPLPLTQDDINWIKGQMIPRVAAKTTGGSSSQSQLLSKVGGGAVEIQNIKTAATTLPTTTNVVQNIESAIYVPLQPIIRTTTATTATALPVPLNIAISWGSGATDLDLYLTGPSGTYYYGHTGSSSSAAYYYGDSVVANGSEVITVRNWTNGSYTAYVKDFNNQSNQNSTVLSTSGVSMRFIKGGTITTTTSPFTATVKGGTSIAPSVSIPASLHGTKGNNWQAVSLNPVTGTIKPINTLQPYNSTATTTTARSPITTATTATAGR